MQNDDTPEFAVDHDPCAKNWDYVVTTVPPRGASAAGDDDDDVYIPDTILWDLAGGNVTDAQGDGVDLADTMSQVELDPTPAVVYDIAPLKTVVLSLDEADALLRDTTGSSEGGLCDIIVRDDDDDSGNPDGFEWMSTAGEKDTAGPVHRDRVESYDHETREDIAETGGPSETDPGFVMALIPTRPTSGTDTILDFEVNDIVEVEPQVDLWADLG